MKKFLFLLILAIILPVAAFCQSVEIDTSNLSGYFASIGSMVVLVLFVIELFKVKLKVKGGLLVFFSWLVSIILAFVGYFLKLGMFAELTILATAMYGIGIGFAANLGADIPTVKTVLSFLFKLLKLKEKATN